MPRVPPAVERLLPLPRPVRAVLVVVLIYLFLIGVSALEAGINVMGADTQERLFSNVDHPLAGLFIGLLGTALVQSSSASTSVIVGLVASGALGVDDAVPMVMGANIGTTVTNTLVSFGHVRQSIEFRRALAAATVHDFFNVMSVMVLLPFELLTGGISTLAERISEALVGTSGSDWKSPFKVWVQRPVEWLEDGLGRVVESSGVLGGTLVAIGFLSIIAALIFITANMRTLVADRVERSMNAILGRGGGIVAMLVGLVITVAVQSSSITTSILIPMSAAGVISLKNVYPVTLGANVGTTVTAILAAMATSRPEALTIALVHTIFNLAGIVIFYAIPLFRPLPMRAAETLAEIAVRRRIVAVAYVVVVFIVVPLLGVAIFR
jgi:sodium-dependent phosphate cotransporter